MEWNLIQTSGMKKLHINADISQSAPRMLYVAAIKWSELRPPEMGYFRGLPSAKNWVKQEIDPANSERFKWKKEI